MSASVWSGEHGFQRAGIGALYQGIRSSPATGSTPPSHPVRRSPVIFTGVADRYTINENEFFNRALGPVYFIGGPTPGNLPETEVRFAADGVLRRAADGSALTDRYVLADSSVELVGTAVASRSGRVGDDDLADRGPGRAPRRGRDHRSLPGRHVVGPGRPLRAEALHGRSPGRPADERRAALRRPPTTTVVARVAGEAPRAVRLTGLAGGRLRVPLVPRDGTCTVDFAVSPTRNPSRVLPGSTDDRELGAHFDALEFVPPE